MQKWIIIPIILVVGIVWYFVGAPGLPKPKTETIAVTSFPESVRTGEPFVITWQIKNPKPILIPHTAIHYGPEPKADISYPNFTEEFNQGSFEIPNVFTAEITIPDWEKLYFRAHAVIEDKNVLAEEQVINIQPAPLPAEKEPLPIEAPESILEPEPPPTSKPQSELEVEPEPKPLAPSIQEFNLEQSVYPGYFAPDPLIVKKSIPVRILATTKQREHINRISIQPWVSRSDTFLPGKTTIIEFTPDEIGDFKIRNIGHGFTGTLKVVE